MVAAAFQLYSVYDLYRARGEIYEVIEPIEGRSCDAPAPSKKWMVTTTPAIFQALADPCIVSNRIQILQEKIQIELWNEPQSEREALFEKLKTILEHMLINLDGKDHAELRQLHTRAFSALFTARYNSYLQGLLAEEARRLIRQALAQGAGQMDIMQDYARPLATFLDLVMLGIDHSRRQEFEQNLGQVSRMLPGNVGFQKKFIGKGLQGAEGLTSIFEATVKSHVDNPTSDDLIGSFLSMGRPPHEMTIPAMCFLAVRAAEGPANLIGNGMLALLLHPFELERLRNYPRLMGSAVEELLRYTPPAEFIPRMAKSETRIAGQKIERGSAVILNVGVANRFNDHITSPEQLDLHRKNNLVFGYGAHECLGQHLARLVGEVAISTLLEQVGAMRLAEPEKLKWAQELGNPDGLRGLETLKVEVLPQRAAPESCAAVKQAAS